MAPLSPHLLMSWRLKSQPQPAPQQSRQDFQFAWAALQLWRGHQLLTLIVMAVFPSCAVAALFLLHLAAACCHARALCSGHQCGHRYVLSPAADPSRLPDAQMAGIRDGVCATLSLEGGRSSGLDTSCASPARRPRAIRTLPAKGLVGHTGWILWAMLCTRRLRRSTAIRRSGPRPLLRLAEPVPLDSARSEWRAAVPPWWLTVAREPRWNAAVGVFLRVTLGLHATWLVNSATHLWAAGAL